MKYDDASWHYENDFPTDLDKDSGATHIGIFLAWMILNGFESESLREEASAELQRLRKREITGPQFLIEYCDEKLANDDLNDLGNAFAEYYLLGGEDGSMYIDDYIETLLGKLPSIYHVEDTWENFEKVRQKIDARFQDWKKTKEESRR